MTGLHAASTVDPEQSLSWSPNLGWIDWHPSSDYGAVIGEFVCAGFLWAPNIGWIHLGDGTPADGIHYANDTGGDYGVNHDGTGRLRGRAWSPNIGWVVFEDQGNPRVDLRTGEFSGAAWMPNAGWLFLGPESTENRAARTVIIAPGDDSDEDGLPDAWELYHAGDLSSLSAEGDASGNGFTNREAYWAGLDPFDSDARFQILDIDIMEKPDGSRYDITWTSRPNRLYRLWFSTDLLNWVHIGPERILPKDGEQTGFRHHVVNQTVPTKAFFRVEVRRPLEGQH